MGEFKDQKELKMAMSGRMGLMAGGVLLIFTALSSTLMYGINFFSLASNASGGDAECLEILESANVSISMIQIAAVCFVIAAIAELAVGALCAALSNRLDKAIFTVRAAALLLGVEILMQVFLFLTGLMNLSLLITSIVIPAYLLWSATRLRKLAKIYPDRKTAVNTKKAREQQKKPATPVQKKSLHERAMMNEAVHRWDEVLERNTGAAGEETEEKTDRAADFHCDYRCLSGGVFSDTGNNRRQRDVPVRHLRDHLVSASAGDRHWPGSGDEGGLHLSSGRYHHRSPSLCKL